MLFSEPKRSSSLESNDADEMKAALEKINSNEEMQQAMARLYQEQAAAAGAEGAGPQAGPAPEPETAGATADDNVVDAEVEDVDESK
jgi:molecular chaperone DnaK